MSSKPTPKYKWFSQTMAEDLALVKCPSYDPIKDFKRDKSGYYILVRIDPKDKTIELAVVSPKHVVEAVFRGKKCQDVYVALFDYEKKHQKKWFLSDSHKAYIGKELKKAELALIGKEEYWQE